MSFGDLLADLDATAFAELSDDTAAVWYRMEGVTYTVAAMLEGGERPSNSVGLASFMAGTVVRLSAAEVASKVPDLSELLPAQIAEVVPQYASIFPPPLPRPMSGEQITVLGRRYIFHGDPWLDEASGGRDWVCPVTKA